MEILKLQEYALKLKKVKRKGWLIKGIRDGESVADHSFGTAFLTLAIAAELNYDLEKCMSLAIIHDLAESIVDDITPHDNIRPQEKIKAERDAFAEIGEKTGFPKLIELAEEYLENKTKESRIVHDMDKLEMAFQALEYESQSGKDLSELFTYSGENLSLGESKKILDGLLKQR